LVELETHFIAVNEFSTLGRCIPLGNLLLNLRPVRGEPDFLFVQHRYGVFHEFVDGLVGAALNVLSNQRFEFRSKAYFHVDILTYVPSGCPREGTCGIQPSVRNRYMNFRMASAFVVCLCIITGLAIPSTAQDKDKDKSDAAYIRSMELKWTESYKKRQVDILASLLADDFVITVEDGNTYGKTGYISHSAESSTHVEVAEMSELKVRMHGNTAVVTGAYHERGMSGGKPYEYHDRLTDVWMKNGGKWQVVASHYSVPLK
jgi:ketosteroid isomerase-like protein